MASITVPNFDSDLLNRLLNRADRNGRSVGEESLFIFREALADEPPVKRDRSGRSLAQSAREIFGPLGGVELDLPSRWPKRDPDGARLRAVLTKLGVESAEAEAAVQDVQGVASEKMMARVEAQSAALRAELKAIRWVLVVGMLGLGAIITATEILLRFLATAP